MIHTIYTLKIISTKLLIRWPRVRIPPRSPFISPCFSRTFFILGMHAWVLPTFWKTLWFHALIKMAPSKISSHHTYFKSAMQTVIQKSSHFVFSLALSVINLYFKQFFGHLHIHCIQLMQFGWRKKLDFSTQMFIGHTLSHKWQWMHALESRLILNGRIILIKPSAAPFIQK